MSHLCIQFCFWLFYKCLFLCPQSCFNSLCSSLNVIEWKLFISEEQKMVMMIQPITSKQSVQSSWRTTIYDHIFLSSSKSLIVAPWTPHVKFHLYFIWSYLLALCAPSGWLCCLLKVKPFGQEVSTHCGGRERAAQMSSSHESDNRHRGEKWPCTAEISHEDKWPTHRTWVKEFL